MHTDPFGHSAFTPYLYSTMEYKAFIPNRMPDPLKQVKYDPPEALHDPFWGVLHVVLIELCVTLALGKTALSLEALLVSCLSHLLQDFKQQKHLEFFWYPPYLDNPQPIFAHVLDSHYTTPVIFGVTIKVQHALTHKDVWVLVATAAKLLLTVLRKRLLHLWRHARSVLPGTSPLTCSFPLEGILLSQMPHENSQKWIRLWPMSIATVM